MAKRKKKLTLDAIFKNEQSFDKVKSVLVDKEQNIHVKYAPKFKKSKIDEVLVELLQTLVYVENNKDEMVKQGISPFPETDNDALKYLTFLMVKHFTELEDALKGRDHDTHIATMYALYDKGWMDALVEEFDLNEQGKVFDAYYKMVEATAELEKQSKSMKTFVEENVQTEVLKSKLLGDENGEKSAPVQ